MSSKTGSDTPPCDFDGSTVHTARCKWFNNKAGYGFLTVVRSPDESKVGSDVFAHHTGITVGSEQYKYLVQGEYVDFTMRETDSGDHAIQAANITGVGGEQLMCETRNEQRKQQEQNRGEDDASKDDTRGERRTKKPNRRVNAQVRLRGEGPREGEVWTLTRSNAKKPSQPRKEDEE